MIPCDVPTCRDEGFPSALGDLCPRHDEQCERDRDGASWTQAFIDAGPDANEGEITSEWYSRWLVEQAS